MAQTKSGREGIAFVRLLLSLATCQPARGVTDVSLDVSQRLRVPFVTIARRLEQKTWATHLGVPVVVREMMKTGLRDAAPERVTVIVD